MTNSGISFTTVLGIVFVVLKLTHLIAWSWWWVLAPFWIPALIALVVILVVLVATWIGDRA